MFAHHNSEARILSRLSQALRQLLHQQPPRPQHPHLLPALLHQVPRLRSVHQLHQLRSLAASWLEAPHLLQLDLHLQERLHQLATHPQPSQKSTSSRTRTAQRTGKHRR